MAWRRRFSNPRFDGVIEAMEPRLLFNADPVVGTVGAPPTSAEPSAQVQVMPPSQQSVASASSSSAQSTQTQQQAAHEIVFVDAGVTDAQRLVDDLLAQQSAQRTLEVHWLDGQRDGLTQINEVLGQRQDISAIHLISHGADGQLQLGATLLDQSTLSQHAQELAAWSASLRSGADILVYGCDVAETASGQAFVKDLSLLTGADVAASTDLTGARLLGGDWTLEYQVGQIETAVAPDATTQADWQGLLSITSAGSETKVNSTTGAYTTTGRNVVVGVAGNYTVMWQTSGGIYAQRYTAAGATSGSLITVTTGASLANAQIELNGYDGGFAIVWNDASSVYFKTYNSDGTVDVSTTTVASGSSGGGTTTTYSQPTVARELYGDFVVAYKKTVVTGATTTDQIQFKAYTNAGALQASNSSGNVSTAAQGNDAPSISMNSSGGFVVSWTDSSGKIFASVYDNSRNVGSSRFDVTGGAGGSQSSVSMDYGSNDIVVAYVNNGNIYYSYYTDSSGTVTAVTTAAQVNQDPSGTTPSDLRSAPAVRFDNSDHKFIIAWQNSTQDGSGDGVFMRLFYSSPTGASAGPDVQVNTSTTNDQQSPSLAFYNGKAMVVWSGNGTQSGQSDSQGVFFQRYTIADKTAPTLSVPASTSVIENMPSAITGISITDVDSAPNDTLTLSVGSGTLSATASGNVTVSGSGTATLILTGSVADINSFISASGVKFRTAQDSLSSVTLSSSAYNPNTTLTSSSGSTTVNVTAQHAPTITSGATVTLTTTDEDTTSSATQVSAILSSASWADTDPGALSGIAITAKVGNGTWQYSTDGVSWTAFGSVSATNALLLTSGSYVRYIPNGNNGETATFAFKAWDQTSGTASTNSTPGYATTASSGSATAYSSNNATGSLTVTSVNDAPTITNGATVTLTTTDEDTTSSATLVSSILTSASWADVDTSASSGIAITSKSGNGTWQYSTDGVTWNAFGAVSSTNALLLTSTSRVRYIPDGSNGETATFGFKAWDRTSGTASTNATPGYATTASSGGTTAYSSNASTASMTVTSVSDAPVYVSASNFTSITEDQTSNSGQLVSTLFSSTDADSGAVNGIAVYSQTPSNGTWQYSTDNGTNWTAVGTVSGSSALLLRSTDKLRFVPDALNADAASLSFYIWDQTSGTAGNKVDVSTRGGTTAFSSSGGTSSITVTAVNDAPTATITPTSYSATEQVSLTLHGTGLSIADVDAGSATVQAILSVVSGTITVSAGSTGVSVSNSGTSSVTLSGTLTQINNLLAGNSSGTVTYIINSNAPPASDTLTLQASDLGNTGTGGTLTASDTATINITATNDSPTGSVSISGTPTQGQTLTASNNILDADGLGTITYHWLRGGVDTGSTGSTYLLTESDVGAAMSAKATYTDAYGTLESVTSSATAAVANVNDSPTGSVTVTGTATQGQTLTASNNIVDADGMGAITYHWLRGGVDTGSTGTTYVLSEADVGSAIAARAYYTDGHGTAETVTSTATASVANVNDSPTGSVTVTGTATQGQTLTASNNILDADGLGTITYHWLRGGVDTGSTGTTYVLSESDVGSTIAARATYTDGHGTAETVTSSATAAVANVNDSPTGSVTVSGTATQGQTLTASNNILDADGMGAITYHWLRGGVDTGSTGTTYLLGEADVGSTIAARAYYTDGHGTAETVTSTATASVANVNDSPTGSVTVTGTATQGQTLTASNNIADPDGLGTITYHWLRGGVDTGSTGTTYVLSEADVGSAIAARATYTDGHGTAETVTSSATAAVANVNDSPTGSVTVTGTATQGQTLTASNNIADPDGLGTITYHWLRGGVDTGSTGTTYVLSEADVGSTIAARATYTDGHGTAETVTSSATAAVANVNDSPTGSVTVTGTATQGQTLTASNNIVDADGMGTITYHWLRGGVDTGSTGTTYVLSEADVGSTIAARATYTDGHGTAETVTSSATAAVANVNDSPTGSVTVTGTATQGQTLTASNNILDADGMGTITYHWLRGGVDTGSTGSTYVLSEADVGSTIAARATYTDGHGTAETVTSSATAAVANVNDSPTGSVTVSGTATQGQTLTANNTILDADGMGAITYHWLRGGVDTGSTGSTYVLSEADVGSTIAARAYYTDGHGTAETVTSSATAAVANVNDSPTGSVTVTGTATQGQTLTASNNIVDADGMGTITYHWLRGGVDTGSTGTTYVLSEADVGSAIAARAYYTDGHGTAETVTSTATASVANVNDSPTGSVTVTGTATQGQTLTASNNIADPDGMGAITYHWLRGGVDTGSTGSTYVLSEADVGSAIAARATYTDGHGTLETVTNSATAAVANVNDSPTGSVTVTGTATQGQTLTASNNIVDADGMGAITYHWLRGGVDTGSTGTTYVLSEADVGSAIAARATYTDGHGTAETVTSSATAAVANLNDSPTGSVTVTGTATQGQTLTASNNIVDADGMGAITYHWLRGGVDTGSTGATYILSESDVGSTIAARATYTDGHGTAETVTSAATAAVANVNDAPTGSVSIAGTASKGETLTASNNIVDADGMGAITYHWLRDGVDTGSTGNTYLLGNADVGTVISAQASYTDGHGTLESVTSAATGTVTNFNNAPTGSVSIAGTATQGQTLAASDNISDADGMGTITYHWLRDGVDTGSTGASYLLGEADVGKAISVQASYVDGQSTTETVASAATAAVANVNDAPTGSVSISGTATQGQTLTASNNILDADGLGALTYHWLRDGVDTGSTGTTYLLSEADVGTAISAQATYTDGHGTPESVTSAATAAVANVNDAPTGSVTITGTATQGQTLTASDNIADADGLGTLTYHWLRGGVDTGSTGTTYLLSEADVGAAISVQAAYTDGHGAAETVTSSATAAVANVNDSPTGSVTVTGTATQGQTLAASNNILDADGLGTITYHWLRDGVDTGTTGTTYLLGEADVGAALSASAMYTDGHGTLETVTSSATAAVANVNDAPTGSVTVSGTATQGQTLTASNNILDADGLGAITYHWLRDGVDTGSTGSTYLLGEADVGAAISASATYTDGHSTFETVTSAATAAVANVNDAPTGTVTVTGTATQGQTLTASDNILDADGLGTITYHWLRDGIDTGTTGASYLLGEADVGAAISASATYADGHGTLESVTSSATAAVANVNDAPTGSVTLTGTATQGQTLTASNNILDADGMGAITYHWLRGGVDTGSTGATYVLSEADVGATIAARATYTDGHGTLETVTSSATAAVANVNDSPTGSVTVTGTATQGQTLTASDNILDADGMGTITYHWLRGGVDTGSTGTTYVLSEADVGSAIAARATYTDGHGTVESVASAATAAVANVNDSPTGSVTITGTATQGQTLTASNSILDADGMGTITYHWLRGGVDTGSTGSTYALTEADVGAAIAARVTYTDGHGTAETVTSSATAAVANVNDAPTGSVTLTGTATQGQTLTASNNILDADGMGTITYHWLRGGVDTGSTGTTYALSEADVGSTIAARATYTDGHGTAETVTSSATSAVANVNDAPTGSVTVTGTATQGQTLTASNNILDADGLGTITYHWLRGGVDTGSTGTTYALTEADVGSTIAALASYTDGHGTAESVTSSATAAVANVNDSPTGSVTVTGTATQGQTLTASNNILDADGMGAITYHWLRGGVDTGSTGTTYVLSEADVGAAISASVTYTDGHGTLESVTSAATAAVANLNDAPTGTVTLSGNATQGQTLTASNNILDADGLGTITYHWLRAGVDTGSTGSTYVLSEADVGAAISARATYTDGHGTLESVTSVATSAVANINDAPTGSVTVNGTVAQGQTLTASDNILDADGLGTITYHWLRAGIDTGVTGSTYLLTEADVGSAMAARATYTDGHGTFETVTSTATASVANVNDAPTGSVTITGTATQGQTLTASDNILDADGLGTVTYHWLRGGVDTGSTGTTYVLSEADVGSTIAARATYTDGHGTVETVPSSATASVANINDAPTGSVTLSGAATQGQTLTASDTILDADGLGTITYHWLRGGVDTGATGSTYILSESDVGSTIAARATYTDGHDTAESVTSAATASVANVNDAPTGSVTLSGTATQGQTLTASNIIADADGLGTITYHWLRDGVDTSSTGSTYLLSQADVGAVISARATYTDGHGTFETVTSAATASVANVNDAPTGSVAITGTARQGQTLTASDTILDADGLGTITYHWLRDGVDTSATGSTYLLSQADVGAHIAVHAVYVDGAGTTETVSSSATSAVLAANSPPLMSAQTLSAVAMPSTTWQASELLAQASDPDNDPLTIVIVQAPQHGSLAFMPNGDLQYIVDTGYAGPDSFTYRAFDGQAASAATRQMSIQAGPAVQPTLPPVTDTPTSTPRPDPQPTDIKPPASVEVKTETKAPATPPATPTRENASQDTAPEELHQHIAGSAWARQGATEQIGARAQTLFNASGTSFYNGAVTDKASGALTFVNLLDLIQPRVEHALGINLLLTPLSSVTHALPANTDVGLLGHSINDNPAAVRITHAVGYSTGLGLAVGTVWWTARISGLLTSALISTPAWRSLDPLPILNPSDDDNDEQEHMGDGDVERLFDADPPVEHELPVIQ